MKKIRRGGITYGKSHSEGGIPVKNNGTGEMLEVEGGEGIVNKRSMASDKMVSVNGKKMTICEAVSELNQLEGGVQFSCDDVEHKQFIEEMARGGELERGTRTEREHIDTLRKLYEQRITPKQATKEVAQAHLKEDPRYYSKLAKMESKMANGGMSENLNQYINIQNTKMGEYEVVSSLNTLKALEKNGFIKLKETTGQTQKVNYVKSEWLEEELINRKVRHDDIERAIAPKFTSKGKEYFIGYNKGGNFLRFYVLKKGEDWAKYNSEPKMGDGGKIRKDRSGNEIGDGNWHSSYNVFEFSDYPQISHQVDKSNSTESVYVRYTNNENHKSIKVRFSTHENNATKFGDELDGNFATRLEVLYHLGLAKRTFVPKTRLIVPSKQIAKKDLGKYQSADMTIQEMYALGEGADISNYKGKLAKNSNYLITGNAITNEELVMIDSLGRELIEGKYVYEELSKKDSKMADGGEVEDFISKGIVELKMYETTPEHAREYGINSRNPLYIQTICVNNDSRLKGIGTKVLTYIDEYARKNGNDVVFGHIAQKAEFTKDERQNFFCDNDLIKDWLYSNGYAINNDNNDFHKVIQKNVRYNHEGEIRLDKSENEIGDGGMSSRFTLVIKNIKNPSAVGKDGVKNMYKGSYAKIFDILDEDSVLMQAEASDQKLIGNDLYVTFDSKPNPSQLEKILKLKDVSIDTASNKMKKGGQTKDNPFASMGLKKDFVGGWEDKMDFFLKKSDNYCDVEKKYCQSNIDIDRADMPQIYEEYIPQYVDFLEEQGIDSNMDYDVKVGSLHPTQKNISLSRMKRMLHRLLEGYYTDTEGKKLNPLKRVIVATKDGYVLDGHHRWATSLFLSPNNTVDVLRVNENIKDLVPINKQFGMVEFQKFMYGGLLTESKPLIAKGGNFPGKGLQLDGIEYNGEEMGFSVTIAKRSLNTEFKLYPNLTSDKIAQAIQNDNAPLAVTSDTTIELSATTELMKIYKHQLDFFVNSTEPKLKLIRKLYAGRSIEYYFIFNKEAKKYLEDVDFLDNVLKLINQYIFQDSGTATPISFGKKARKKRGSQSTQANSTNTTVRALADDVQYRFKTLQEFIDEYGVNWRSKVGWTSMGGMDYLFGQVIDMSKNSSLTNLIDAKVRVEVDQFGCVVPIGKDSNWMLGYRMFTSDASKKTQFTVPPITSTPQKSDDFKVGDVIRLKKEKGVFEYLKGQNKIERNIFTIRDIGKDVIFLDSEDGKLVNYPLYVTDKSLWIEKGNPTLIKLDDTKDYRIKTEEEFINDFGDDWREEYDWSPYGASIYDSKDQLFGKVFKVGSADSEEELEINKALLSKLFDVFRLGASPNSEMKDKGIPDWYYKKEYFVEIEPQEESFSTQPQVPKPIVNQGLIDLDNQIEAIQVLMNSFTEDEIDVRRFLLNQIKELRIQKEKLISSKYFSIDMSNLLNLYADKVTLGQRSITAPNGCGLDTPSGKPSELSYDQYKLVRTQEFKNWFGDWELAYQTKNYNDVSKAINKNTGEPMVMYHGKANMKVEATYFNLSGFPIKYFAENYTYSKWFAEHGQGIKVLYEFFVKVVNPIDLSKVGLDDITPEVFKVIISSLYGYEIQTPLVGTSRPMKMWMILRTNPQMLRELRDNTNFDGLILYENNPQDLLPNGEENTTLDFTTFNNTQQKAADGRNTTFFNEVEDVRFAKGGVTNNC